MIILIIYGRHGKFMDLDKIRQVQSYLEGMDEKIRKIRYKIIIIKDSYFFYVDQGYIRRYYEGQHKDLKGWYAGVLSFSREESLLYVFISEILYDHIDAIDLFLKILYQMLIYSGADFFKLKFKKLKKRLHNYLLENLPKHINVGSDRLDNLLAAKDDAILFGKAAVIIPHMSLYNLIERLPSSEDTVLYIQNIKSHLQPFEYMPPLHEEPRHRHIHS